ncbi:MAG: transcription/translation regulatory transformer protein RfaH [Burkholderiaceae bacterium]|nr:transcription/translation regulatory transformer protein RfaH [Burkholderiaceae bacterium]
MHWHLIHTKPRQERVALQNFEQQGVPCYLPLRATEKLSGGALAQGLEPLFPRYLFIELDDEQPVVSWSSVRSTRGVNRLVCFGPRPAIVDPTLVEQLRAFEPARRNAPVPLFGAGKRIRIVQGPFSGLEAVYQMTDGERRAMVLIEILSRPVQLAVPVSALRNIG